MHFGVFTWRDIVSWKSIVKIKYNVWVAARYQIKIPFGLFIIGAEVLLNNSQSDGKCYPSVTYSMLWLRTNVGFCGMCLSLHERKALYDKKQLECNLTKYGNDSFRIHNSWFFFDKRVWARGSRYTFLRGSLSLDYKQHTHVQLTLLPYPVPAHATGYHVVTHTNPHTVSYQLSWKSKLSLCSSVFAFSVSEKLLHKHF